MTILANSALSFSLKRSVITQEALRRVWNTNRGVEAQNKHLSLFMAKVRKSGYSRKFGAQIIHRIPLYRDRETLEN